MLLLCDSPEGTSDLAPVTFGHLQQIERHHQPRGAGAGPLRHAFAQPDRRERGLDRIRCAQMLPVFRRVVEVRQEAVLVASDHMRIVTQPSRASATKMVVISAPMILAIAVPSSVLSHSSG